MKRKRAETHPPLDLSHHQDVLQWPDCPSHLVVKSHYKQLSIDNTIVCSGKVAYNRKDTSGGTEQEYCFVRVLAPSLLNDIGLVLSSFPSDLVKVVADYYGDRIRMIGALFRGIDTDFYEQFGYGNLCVQNDHIYYSVSTWVTDHVDFTCIVSDMKRRHGSNFFLK